jgi:hypothetical protein
VFAEMKQREGKFRSSGSFVGFIRPLSFVDGRRVTNGDQDVASAIAVAASCEASEAETKTKTLSSVLSLRRVSGPSELRHGAGPWAASGLLQLGCCGR